MSIAKRTDGKWRARYRDPPRKQRSRDFTKKLDATRWLAESTAKVSVGDWADPSLARVTVGERAALWMASQVQLEPGTRVRYAGIVRNHILPVWDRVQPTPQNPGHTRASIEVGAGQTRGTEGRRCLPLDVLARPQPHRGWDAVTAHNPCAPGSAGTAVRHHLGRDPP